jgi:hypothetical protein
MKTALLLVGGAICMSAWQANAAEAISNPSPGTSETVITSRSGFFWSLHVGRRCGSPWKKPGRSLSRPCALEE